MKALVCITTANRCAALKRFIWEYAEFCSRQPEYSLLVSLDGNDPATIVFCRKHGFPLLYSDDREGVGISKNRVLRQFPDFDHYFFIEDDVGLVDGSVFANHIDMAKDLNLHHLSLFPRERLPDDAIEMTTSTGRRIICAKWGSAQFNYFSKAGIDIVGGFHPMFAQYRRFGHTEHSYRFVNAGLAQYPFYMIKDCLGKLSWADPVSVTRVKVNTVNRIFEGEHELIQQKLWHVPITTLSAYHFEDTRKPLSGNRPIGAIWYRVTFDTQMLLLAGYRQLRRLVWPKRNQTQ